MSQRRYGRGGYGGSGFKTPSSYSRVGQRSMPYTRTPMDYRKRKNNDNSGNRNENASEKLHTSKSYIEDTSNPGRFTEINIDLGSNDSKEKQASSTRIKSQSNDSDKRIAGTKTANSESLQSGRTHSASMRSNSSVHSSETGRKHKVATSKAVEIKPVEEDVLDILADDNRFDEESERLFGAGAVSSTIVVDVKSSKKKDSRDYKSNIDEPFQIHAESADSLCGDDSNTRSPSGGNNARSRSNDHRNDRKRYDPKQMNLKEDRLEHNRKSVHREASSRTASRIASRIHGKGHSEDKILDNPQVISRKADADGIDNDLKGTKVISKHRLQFHGKPQFRSRFHEKGKNFSHYFRNSLKHKEDSGLYKHKVSSDPPRERIKQYMTESNTYDKARLSHVSQETYLKYHTERNIHNTRGYGINRNRGNYYSRGTSLSQSTMKDDELDYRSRSDIDRNREDTKTIYITDGKTHSDVRRYDNHNQEHIDPVSRNSASQGQSYIYNHDNSTKQFDSNLYARSSNEQQSGFRNGVKLNPGLSSRNQSSRFMSKKNSVTMSIGLRHYDKVRKKYFRGNISKNISRIQRPHRTKTKFPKTTGIQNTVKAEPETERIRDSAKESKNHDFAHGSSPKCASDEMPLQVDPTFITHDPNEQLVFLPNPELQNSNVHIMDEFGNIVNPELITPVGCSQSIPMQLDSSAVPIPIPGTEYVFIPFASQLPGLTANVPFNQGIPVSSLTDNFNQLPSTSAFKSETLLNNPSDSMPYIQESLEEMYMIEQSMTFGMEGLVKVDEGIAENQTIVQSGILDNTSTIDTRCTDTIDVIDQNKHFIKSENENSGFGKYEECGKNEEMSEIDRQKEDVTNEAKTAVGNADKKRTFRKKGEPRTAKTVYNHDHTNRQRNATNTSNTDKRILKIKRNVEQEVSDIRKVVETSEAQRYRRKIQHNDLFPPESESVTNNSVNQETLYEQRAISPLHITFQNDHYAQHEEMDQNESHIKSLIQKHGNKTEIQNAMHNTNHDQRTDTLTGHHRVHNTNTEELLSTNDRCTDTLAKKTDRQNHNREHIIVNREDRTCEGNTTTEITKRDEKRVEGKLNRTKMRFSTYIQPPNNSAMQIAISREDTNDRQRNYNTTREINSHRNDREHNYVERTRSEYGIDIKPKSNIDIEISRSLDDRVKTDTNRTGTMYRDNREPVSNVVSEIGRRVDDRIKGDVDRKATIYLDDRQNASNIERHNDGVKRDNDRTGTIYRDDREPASNVVGEIGRRRDDLIKGDIDRKETLYLGVRQNASNAVSDIDRHTDRVNRDNDRTGTIYRDDGAHWSNASRKIGRCVDDRRKRDEEGIRYRDEGQSENSNAIMTNEPQDERMKRDYERTKNRSKNDMKNENSNTVNMIDRSQDDRGKKAVDRTGTIHMDDREHSSNAVGEIGMNRDCIGKNDDRTGTVYRHDRSRYRDEQGYKCNNKTGTIYRDDRETEGKYPCEVDRRKHNKDNDATETHYLHETLPLGKIGSGIDIHRDKGGRNNNDQIGSIYMDCRPHDGINAVETERHRDDRWNNNNESTGTIYYDDRDGGGDEYHEIKRYRGLNSTTTGEIYRSGDERSNKGNIRSSTRCMYDKTNLDSADGKREGRRCDRDEDKDKSGTRNTDTIDDFGCTVNERDGHTFGRGYNDSDRTGTRYKDRRQPESSNGREKDKNYHGKVKNTSDKTMILYGPGRQSLSNIASEVDTHRDKRGYKDNCRTEIRYTGNKQYESIQQEENQNEPVQGCDGYVREKDAENDVERYNAYGNNIIRMERANQQYQHSARTDRQYNQKQVDAMDYSTPRELNKPKLTLQTSEFKAVDISTALVATSHIHPNASDNTEIRFDPNLPPQQSEQSANVEEAHMAAVTMQAPLATVTSTNLLQQPGFVVGQPVQSQINQQNLQNIASQRIKQSSLIHQLQLEQQILSEQRLQEQLQNQLVNMTSINPHQNVGNQSHIQGQNTGIQHQQLVIQQANQQQAFQQFQTPTLQNTQQFPNQPLQNAVQPIQMDHQQSSETGELLHSLNQLQQVQQLLSNTSPNCDQQAVMQPKVIGTLMARPTDAVGSGVPGIIQQRMYSSSQADNRQNKLSSRQQTPAGTNMAESIQTVRGGKLIQLSTGSQHYESNPGRSGTSISQSYNTPKTLGTHNTNSGVNKKQFEKKYNEDKRNMNCSRCNMQFSNIRLYNKHLQWHDYYIKHFKQ